MRRLARRTWNAATELAGTRHGALSLVAASLVVYAIQSLGWPAAPGTGPRVVPRRLRRLLAFRRGLPVGDAQPDARGAARRRRHPRPRQPVPRRGLRRDPLRRVDPALRTDRAPLRPRTGAAGRRRPRPLPGLRHRLPRAGERDRVRGGVRRMDRRRGPGGALSVRVAVRRGGRRNRAHRADPTREPGLPDRGRPRPPRRWLVARSARADNRLRGRRRRAPRRMGGDEPLAVRRPRRRAGRPGQPAVLPRIRHRPHRRSRQRARLP